MRTRLATLAASALLASGALAACGGSSGGGNGVASKSPDQIIRAASNAITHAKSVHVSGSITASGVPLTVDLTLVSGKGGRGRMSEGGLGFRIVNLGQTVYIQGSPSFWQHFGGAAAARLLQGRWLKAPATGQFASIAALTDMQKLMADLLANHGTLAKGSTTTIRGQRVVPISDKTQGGTLYVATTGHPYPLEIRKQGSNGGKIVFDQFNQPVSLTPPTNAIDLSQLG